MKTQGEILPPGTAPDFAGNIARFTGFAALYNECRPGPPAVLGDLLRNLAHAARPSLVVDLGSGTGLSTRFWADQAEAVVGIEPTADMRNEARGSTTRAMSPFRKASRIARACRIAVRKSSVACRRCT